MRCPDPLANGSGQRDATKGGDRHGGDGRVAAQRLVPQIGDFPPDLELWRESVMAALAQPEKARATPQETKQVRRQIRGLEKVLRRKDKALAETAALLALSK